MIIIRCNDCKQDVAVDESKHLCTACALLRDPKTWKAKRRDYPKQIEKCDDPDCEDCNES